MRLRRRMNSEKGDDCVLIHKGFTDGKFLITDGFRPSEIPHGLIDGQCQIPTGNNPSVTKKMEGIKTGGLTDGQIQIPTVNMPSVIKKKNQTANLPTGMTVGKLGEVLPTGY